MKILYVAFRHNPLNPDAASGADYQFLQAPHKSSADISIIGPYKTEPWLIEKTIMKAHKFFSEKKYAKYPITTAWQVSQALNQAVKTHSPDLVFTIFPSALTFYNGNIPCVYRQDTSFWAGKINIQFFRGWVTGFQFGLKEKCLTMLRQLSHKAIGTRRYC
jgi:hypothetical protein